MSKRFLLKDQIRGKCEIEKCNNLQQVAPKSKLGFKRFTRYCTTHLKIKYNQPRRIKGYRKPYNINFRKATSCERCGFIPKDRCQLDIHHKDRNRKNNKIENLETICANCHRLEHKEERENRIFKKP